MQKPVNQLPYGDNDVITFGRFKGAKMANLPTWYLLKLWESKNATPQVLGYIQDNLSIIQKEASKR